MVKQMKKVLFGESEVFSCVGLLPKPFFLVSRDETFVFDRRMVSSRALPPPTITGDHS